MAGMFNRIRMIQDGNKKYKFQPGKGGSLTLMNPGPARIPITKPVHAPAKVIGRPSPVPSQPAVSPVLPPKKKAPLFALRNMGGKMLYGQ